MSNSSRIIDKFGGQSALAKLLNKRQSTIRHWYINGIPAKWQIPLIDLAKKHGVSLQPEEFFEGTQDREKNLIVPKIPEATHWGDLLIGDATLPCYVLDTGERVFALKGVMVGLIEIEGGPLADYLMVKSLRSYLPSDLIPDQDSNIPALIEFDTGTKGFAQHALGLPVERFIDLCVAYSTAAEKEQLTEKQQKIAINAARFLRATAKVGIIALVDEVTGYQYERIQDALQLKLKLFLEEEMRPWEATFPDELWIEFQRLTNWTGPLHLRPKWWGKLVNELIYGYLDEDVFNWLKVNVPKPKYGQNYHQWLSSQFGLKKLIEHIWITIGMARACHTIEELRERMAIQYGRHKVQLSLFLPVAAERNYKTPEGKTTSRARK
ncbi:MAG: P63C domain-containing protein [Thermodesulfobacteriota bacterium]